MKALSFVVLAPTLLLAGCGSPPAAAPAPEPEASAAGKGSMLGGCILIEPSGSPFVRWP